MMKETPQPAPAQVREPFSSLEAMRSVHGELLKMQSEAADLPVFVEEMTAFLCRAQRTGVLLDADRDRATAQTLMDYWVTALYRATGKEQPEFVLAMFDPKASARELAEDEYPYGRAIPATGRGRRDFTGTQRLVRECLEKLDQNRLGVRPGKTPPSLPS
jgi:hypothetical protein